MQSCPWLIDKKWYFQSWLLIINIRVCWLSPVSPGWDLFPGSRYLTQARPLRPIKVPAPSSPSALSVLSPLQRTAGVLFCHNIHCTHPCQARNLKIFDKAIYESIECKSSWMKITFSSMLCIDNQESGDYKSQSWFNLLKCKVKLTCKIFKELSLTIVTIGKCWGI